MRQTLLRKCLLGVALGGAGVTAATDANAELFVGLTDLQRIVRFSSANPTTLVSNVPVSGLANGNERLLSLDLRPADGRVYAVSNQDRLYTVDPASGVATAVFPGTTFAAPYFNVFGGIQELDINPVADRIRYVQGSFNARLNPTASGQATGGAVDGNANLAGVQPDTRFSYLPGDVNAAGRQFGVTVRATAYTNNDINPATGTRQFVIENSFSNRSVLAEVTNFNGGTLSTVGTLSLNENLNFVSFDISGATGTAYLLDSTNVTTNRLFTLDLTSAQTTLISDQIPTSGGLIRSFTVAAIPEPALLGAMPMALLGLMRRRGNGRE